jgi:hypothetical protein
MVPPSEEEDRWIKKQELDSQKREQDLKLKELHWMKCPKCGHDLEEGGYKTLAVRVDRCVNCGGTYLDKGEMERIVQEEVVAFGKKMKLYEG